MSAPTIFTIHSSRDGEIVETHRISPFVAVAKARRLHGMARLHHGQDRTAFQAARFGQASRTLATLIDGVAGSAAVPLAVAIGAAGGGRHLRPVISLPAPKSPLQPFFKILSGNG